MKKYVTETGPVPILEATYNIKRWKDAQMLFRTLNNPKVKTLIELFLEKDAPLIVTDIYIKLRWEQSIASQYLSHMRKARLVTTDRQGKFIYYSLNKERLKAIDSLLKT